MFPSHDRDGLLTVVVTILVADLINSANNRFRIESVTNEFGAKTGFTDAQMDSFEIYLEAMLPALIQDQPLRTVKVYHGFESSSVDTTKPVDIVAAGIMEQFGWNPEDCTVTEEEPGFEAAIKNYNKAVQTIREAKFNPEAVDHSAEHQSAADYYAQQYGDQIACLGS